jgi:competence protein ComEC
MATAPVLSAGTATVPRLRLPRLQLSDNILAAPLVPASLALTTGIILDRYAGLPAPISLVALVAALCAAAVAVAGKQTALFVLYFALAAAAGGAAYHHWYRGVYPPDDIGEFATAEPRPVKLRAFLVEEPTVVLHPKNDCLQSFARQDPAVTVFEVFQVHDGRQWIPVSGRAASWVVPDNLKGLHVGDRVEVVGRLVRPQPPGNPGEMDYASYYQDQRIRALVTVDKTPDGVAMLTRGWALSPSRVFPVLRGACKRALQDALPNEQAPIAVALLLGDGSLMTGRDWEKYLRTGVIHVLAISGQHLVVLAAFLWLVLRPLGVRRRRCAWFVGLFLLSYSLMTGGRPPVMRSAVGVCVVCLGMILRHVVMPANSFALAWISVALLNPTDLFTGGCLLSFLSVAVLYWGTGPWLRSYRQDPVERLADQSRPAWQRGLLWLLRVVGVAYGVTIVVWLAVAPLVAAWYHLVSPIGIVIGPPTVVLTSLALITGFLTLLSATVCPPLVPLFAYPTSWALAGCEGLVRFAEESLPGYWYVSDVPAW